MSERSLSRRVAHAVDVVKNGREPTRTFDSNFEMGDGHIVVALIMRKVPYDPVLAQGIEKVFGKPIQDVPWAATEAQYADLTDKELRQISVELLKENEFFFRRAFCPGLDRVKGHPNRGYWTLERVCERGQRRVQGFYATDYADAAGFIEEWIDSATVEGKPFRIAQSLTLKAPGCEAETYPRREAAA